MRCVFCDAELNDGDLTCTKCGKDIQIVPDYNEFDEDYLNGLIGTLSEEERKERLMEREKERRKKEALLQKQKKSQFKKIILAVSIVVVLLVAVLAIVSIVHNIKQKNYNSFEYQLDKAQAAMNEGNLEEAKNYYDRALVLDADNVEVMHALAEIYAELGDEVGQMAFLKQVRTVDPTNELAIKQLISIYDRDEDYDSILDIYYSVSDVPEVASLFKDYLTPEPSFSISSGDYNEAISVSISTLAGNVIYYTIDGQNPKEYGIEYSDAIEFTEEGEHEIQAVCVNKLGLYSSVISQRYNIIFEKPAMPVVSPDGGSFTSKTQITITVPEGCSAYYVWGGDNPNSSSTRYKKPFKVIEGNNVLSVIVINDTTEKCSEIYRGRFEYYKEESE